MHLGKRRHIKKRHFFSILCSRESMLFTRKRQMKGDKKSDSGLGYQNSHYARYNALIRFRTKLHYPQSGPSFSL